MKTNVWINYRSLLRQTNVFCNCKPNIPLYWFTYHVLQLAKNVDLILETSFYVAIALLDEIIQFQVSLLTFWLRLLLMRSAGVVW